MKHKILNFLIILLLITPALAVTIITAPTNIKYDIENGDFEDGTTGWGFSRGVDEGSTFTIVPNGYSGNCAQVHAEGNDEFAWIMQRNIQLDEYEAISVRYKMTNFTSSTPASDDTHVTFRLLNDARTINVASQITYMCHDLDNEWNYMYMEFEPAAMNITGLDGWFDILVQTDNSGYNSEATFLFDDVTLYSRASTVEITTYYTGTQGSISITDDQSDTVSCSSGSHTTFEVEPVLNDINLQVDGTASDGCEISFDADNYENFNDILLTFNGDFYNSYYDIYENDVLIESPQISDGTYEYIFESPSDLSTLTISLNESLNSNPSTGGSSGGSSHKKPTTELIIEEEELNETLEILPTNATVHLQTVTPVNLLSMISAYFGVYTISRIRKQKDYANIVILGSLTIAAGLTAMLFGINPYILNVILSNDSIIYGLIMFYIYGLVNGYLFIKKAKIRK